MKNRFDWTKVAFFSKNYFFGLKYSIRGTYLAILVLPWVVFFLVAGMMQCFGFSVRIMLKMKKKKKYQRWGVLLAAEQCLQRAEDFSASRAVLPARILGVH